MAKKKKIDYSDLSQEELLENIEEETARLQKMRFNHAISVLEDTSNLKVTKKEIARMKTELRAREIEASKSK